MSVTNIQYIPTGNCQRIKNENTHKNHLTGKEIRTHMREMVVTEDHLKLLTFEQRLSKSHD